VTPTDTPGAGALPAFRHEAVCRSDRNDRLGSLASFVAEGVDAGEPVLAALTPDSTAGVASAIGVRARSVRFVDITAVGRNPARIIPVWRAFVDEHAWAGPMRGVGEPVWPGRSRDEVGECAIHESLLNVAFEADRGFTLLCPYDVDAVPAEAVAIATTTHPRIVDDAGPRENPGFAGPTVPEPDLPPTPHWAEIRSFDRTDLPVLRSWVAGLGADLGLSGPGIDDVVLASGEVVSNSVRHGGGTAVVAVWADRLGVVCEVRDRGWIRDPLVGRRRPAPDQVEGYGLWIANQVADLVQIRSSVGRTIVRVHVAFDH
jgi:anti-sigma regulatory factor (Ser/Thr protein kinase)